MEVWSDGTLGDAYFMLLKLWDKNPTKINHYCYDTKFNGAIEKIFSLMGNIEFIATDKKTVHAHDFQVGYLKDGETYTAFPELPLPELDSMFNLPDEYYTIQVQAGVDIKKHPWRFLDSSDTNELPTDAPLVVLGTDNRSIDFLSGFEVIDLRNKTSLFDSFSVIKHSKGFYAPQGLLGFVSLSQKVPTKLWLKHSMEINGMYYRIDRIPEWKDLITYVNKIR